MRYEVSCAVTLYITPADPDATVLEVVNCAHQFLLHRLRNLPEIEYEHESTAVMICDDRGEVKEPMP